MTTKIVKQQLEIKSGTRLPKPILIATREDGAKLYITVEPVNDFIETSDGRRFLGSYGYIEMPDGSTHEEPTLTSIKMSPYWHFLDDPNRPLR